MKSVQDIVSQSDNTFDALLDEINHQKRIITQLQTDNRKLKTNEIRLNKMAESFKTENHSLTQEVQTLVQNVRELEIQLTLPTNERTLAINRTIVDPFPKKKGYQDFKWSYVVTPILAILAVFIGKNWGERQQNNPLSMASISAAASNTEPVASAIAPAPLSTNVPDNYLIIENPLEKEGMVRVLDGYEQKAKILAWINPSEKYKIRTQSPEKKRRTYVVNGKNVTVEDYFYKISDKEQWIHGFFTNKRTYVIN